MEERVKKNTRVKYMILAGVGVCLAIASLLIVVYTLSHRIEEKKYTTNMETAKEYILEENYEAAETLYLKTIELEPQKVDAYKELVSMYIDDEAYGDAYTIASKGLTNTGDMFFSKIIQRMQDVTAEKKEKEEVDILQQVYVPDDDQSKVTARFSLIRDISSYCYQQYCNTYGAGTVKKISDKSVQVKFSTFYGTVYFKNTDADRENIDMPSLKIAQGAKPYRVEITSPTVLFVGYEKGIACTTLQQLFGFDTLPEQSKDGVWWISFSYADCMVKMQTDSKGNISGDSIKVYIEPNDQRAVKWEEPQEEEVQEEEDDGTFVLGGETYTYDVTEIVLGNTQIDSLAPLAKCKNLKNLYLINCGIDDISPLQGCTSLEYLVLNANPFSDVSPLAKLNKLQYFQFHDTNVSDISSIFELDLEVLDTCDSKVPKEQVEEYKNRHPDCICYWDWYSIG